MSKRVAVLLGGFSPEREVSLVSGRACAQALVRKGYDAIEVDPEPHLLAQLHAADPDVVFNALHGEWGEDGRVQGVLEYFQRPYTHSGVLASALAMDKTMAKVFFAQAGLDTPRGAIVPRADLAAHPMDPPYVVKPNAQGSSVGVFIVREGDNRPPEVLAGKDWTLGDALLVEEFIPGRELTVTVLHDRPLAVTEIVTDAAFYDYDAKYAAGGSRHILPAEVSTELERRCFDAALKAHEALGCRGMTRADFRYDPAEDRLALLEVNTQPGMTETSLAPEQAGHAGMPFDDLVAWITEDASCPR